MTERSRTPATAGAPAYPTEAETAARNGQNGQGPGYDHEHWVGRTRVVLQPIAAPSILGLFGFAGATMMVGAWQAGWYGSPLTGDILFPFCATFGGLAQFVAGVWSYRARDGLATAMHGMWGAFWLAFGLLFAMITIHVIPPALVPHFGHTNGAFAFWFTVLGVITGLGTLAAFAESLGLVMVLGPLAVGSILTSVGFFLGPMWLFTAGGYAFTFAALAAVYTAGAMMLEGSFGRTILPLGKYSKAANIPGGTLTTPIEYPTGQPGVRVGQ